MTREDWLKIGAIFAMMALSIVFWSVYEQQGNTMALWADANTDRVILGWEMPASWFQSFNPLMIFIFVPAAEHVLALAGPPRQGTFEHRQDGHRGASCLPRPS